MFFCIGRRTILCCHRCRESFVQADRHRHTGAGANLRDASSWSAPANHSGSSGYVIISEPLNSSGNFFFEKKLQIHFADLQEHAEVNFCFAVLSISMEIFVLAVNRSFFCFLFCSCLCWTCLAVKADGFKALLLTMPFGQLLVKETSLLVSQVLSWRPDPSWCRVIKCKRLLKLFFLHGMPSSKECPSYQFSGFDGLLECVVHRRCLSLTGLMSAFLFMTAREEIHQIRFWRYPCDFKSLSHWDPIFL